MLREKFSQGISSYSTVSSDNSVRKRCRNLSCTIMKWIFVAPDFAFLLPSVQLYSFLQIY